MLAWAHRNFGAPAPAAEAGDWDFDLQASGEGDVPLEIAYDARTEHLSIPPAGSRVTVALTLSGTRAFAEAFRDAFADSA